MTTTANIAATLHDAYQRAAETCTTDDKHEITEEVYYDALGILPPIYGKLADDQFGRFWLGEPYTHSQRGVPVCLECWEQVDTSLGGHEVTGRYFCRLSECPNYHL